MPKNSESNSNEMIAEIRSAEPRWEPAVTSVSELSEEDKKLLLGYVPGPGEMSLSERESAASARYEAMGGEFEAFGAPTAYDLRNVGGKNFITPVKNQGGCGSCVAFGSSATVEGTLRVQRNDPNLAIDLSEAHLFYCLARSQGRRCSGPSGGWWVPPALDCFKNPGVADEPCYPYVAGDQDCTNLCSTWQSRVTKITSWRAMTSAAEMKTWLSTKGPLAACFSVYDDFYNYHSGVYHHVTGGFVGGHCVCVVGYSDSGRFWICKNSWGTGWGESGFFCIAYGDCGIDATMWGVEGVVTPGPAPGQRLPLYRYWNPGIADHFYTTNWNELGAGRYGWGYEGIQCYVFGQAQTGAVPLYRYWNPGIGDHFYTTNWAELGSGRYGWGYEGVQCYVYPQAKSGTVPLYRYWNPSAGDHFYTTNWGELGLGRYGWYFEGIQCWVFAQAAGSGAEGEAAGEGASEAEEEVPSTFAVSGTSGEIPGSFATGGGKAESGPSASFATTGAGSGTSESDEPSGSFKVTQAETRKSGRVTITIETGGD